MSHDMEDIYMEEEQHPRTHVSHRESGLFMRTVDSVFDFFVRALRSIARDAELFIGVALTIIGIFSIKADKFCDGNTADYLSCTRPSTYYFYSPLEISIIVLGVFLILIWFLNSRRER